MKTLFSIIFFFFSFLIAYTQNKNGFILGQVSKDQLEMKIYSKDTSAAAVFLDEFGEAYIDNNGDNNLLLEYKAKIKILKKAGLDEANFKIPLYKNGSTKQLIRQVNATVYNLENGLLVSTALSEKDVFKTQSSEHWDEVTFTLPNVVVGSVFEVSFVLESPFIFNFWPWKFQAHIPKVRSEFWASIPGNYIYNIVFKGFVKLNVNESSIVKDCFTPGGRYTAECALYKYAIKDVPAFIEEDYMTSKNNFISSIDYELSEIRFFDGRVVKYTKTWADVDKELSGDENFGKQLKKSKGFHEKKIASITALANDPKQKAQIVYDYIKGHYQWDGRNSKYTSQDIKEGFASGKGNVGDINLSLVAALQAAGLNADPVILATRDFGLPHELFPVISEFNYVVAMVDLGAEKVMLDATESLMPFGLLPERCLNGKGRLISKQVEESNWVEIKPSQKQIKKTSLNLKIVDGVIKGTLNIISSGYEAFDKRSAILSEESEQKYLEKMQKKNHDITFSDYKVENLKNLSQSLNETMEIEMAIDEVNPNKIYLNPFFVDRWEKNPFRSSQRLYPVDFGAPVESTFLMNLELPDNYKIEENMANSAFTLSANGGRFLLNASAIQNKLSITSIININKVVYSSNEYFSLKELFNRIVESHNSQIVIVKQ